VSEADERRFTEALRRALDDAADRLDADTRARLAFARRRALAAARAPRAQGLFHAWAKRLRRPPMLWSAGAAAFAGATVAVVAVWLWFATPVAPLNGFDDLDVLAAQEHPDFYGELEFYAWLASRTPAT
jgi:hypothetical protein